MGDHGSNQGGKGNQPERWEKLLMALDEKLQLGLLDRLRRVTRYEFTKESAGEALIIETASAEDEEYLSKEPFFHQLELLAQDAIGVERVQINRREE
ncbi:MAG: hypothetical protein J5J00_08710 [Deltaproteobacteria bacterium]|nr:hypothetical protein [Deltaproteobacteria bacterium]